MKAISHINQLLFWFLRRTKYTIATQYNYFKKTNQKLYTSGLCLLLLVVAGACSEDESDPDIDPPTSKITVSAENINPGEEVTFTSASTGQVDKIEWIFEGGNILSSNKPTVKVLYANEGSFKATLKVSNSAGSDDDQKTIQVDKTNTGTNLNADFKSNIRNVAVGSEVTFSDMSSGNPNQWSWSFQGGTPNTSTIENPKVVFNQAGVFRISLTVSNDQDSDTEVKDNYISVFEPANAAFTSDVTEIIEGNTVAFTDQSTNAGQWLWTFPGGTPETSTEQNPVVQYDTSGTYSVTLEVSNSDSTNSITKENFIHVKPAIDIISDLIAHYKFDANLTNEVDAGDPGIAQGNVTYINDRNGNSNAALSFNGTSGYVNYSNPIPGPDYIGDLTFSFWMNTANINTESTILGLFSSKSYIDIRKVNDQIEYRVMFRGNSVASISITEIVKATIPANSWVHVAIRHKATDVFEIFINNKLSGREEITRAQITEKSENSYMGAKDTGSSDQIEYYEGALDDLRIYTRALTNDEIKAVYEEQ
ncbi:PKD domain-containing protein [Aquimarina sp. AU58]|uniref:PKD domain-containing protein n=1 Tax=Aquimarina sp. AU58 TaxID=1874112 RepID=UPI000D654FBB|nr:PKD domain-containing protein [Aquimarina sp. AU58]